MIKFFVFVIFMCLLYFFLYESKSEFVNVKDEVIYLHVGETNLTIDKKYVKGSGGGINYKGDLVSLSMWALLPDFYWYDRKLNHNKFVDLNKNGHGEKIFIDLNFEKEHLMLQKFFKKHPSFKMKSRLVNGEYTNKVNGLERYDRYDSTTDLFIYRNKDNEPEIMLNCSIKGSVSFPICRGFWDYNEDVRVRVSFSKNYLNIWKDIQIFINTKMISKLNKYQHNINNKIINNGEGKWL